MTKITLKGVVYFGDEFDKTLLDDFWKIYLNGLALDWPDEDKRRLFDYVCDPINDWIYEKHRLGIAHNVVPLIAPPVYDLIPDYKGLDDAERRNLQSLMAKKDYDKQARDYLAKRQLIHFMWLVYGFAGWVLALYFLNTRG